jgi:DNA processing protein
LTLGSAQDEQENPLLDAMGFDPVGLDALLARTGLDAATLQARLLELELDNAVARLPGGLFQRLSAA